MKVGRVTLSFGLVCVCDGDSFYPWLQLEYCHVKEDPLLSKKTSPCSHGQIGFGTLIKLMVPPSLRLQDI